MAAESLRNVRSMLRSPGTYHNVDISYCADKTIDSVMEIVRNEVDSEEFKDQGMGCFPLYAGTGQLQRASEDGWAVFLLDQVAEVAMAPLLTMQDQFLARARALLFAVTTYCLCCSRLHAHSRL
jgi:hypothetical protein